MIAPQKLSADPARFISTGATKRK